MAKDFIARQTLNGLGTFSLFTVPSDGASGLYFVNGQVTIPTSGRRSWSFFSSRDYQSKCGRCFHRCRGCNWFPNDSNLTAK
jgi:hypothetical protein